MVLQPQAILALHGIGYKSRLRIDKIHLNQHSTTETLAAKISTASVRGFRARPITVWYPITGSQESEEKHSLLNALFFSQYKNKETLRK